MTLLFKLPIREIQHGDLLNQRLNLLLERVMCRVLLDIVVPVVCVLKLNDEGVGEAVLQSHGQLVTGFDPPKVA